MPTSVISFAVNPSFESIKLKVVMSLLNHSLSSSTISNSKFVFSAISLVGYSSSKTMSILIPSSSKTIPVSPSTSISISLSIKFCSLSSSYLFWQPPTNWSLSHGDSKIRGWKVPDWLMERDKERRRKGKEKIT